MTAPLVPHPWDKAREGLLLDEINREWEAAKAHRAQADDLRNEAENQDGLADEADDRADALAQRLLVDHPDWREYLLMDQVDPRTVVGDEPWA